MGQLVPPEIGYKKPPPQTQSFAAATSEVTGQSKRDINRNVARAEAIGPDILKLSGTSLDKGVLYRAWPGDTVSALGDTAIAHETPVSAYRCCIAGAGCMAAVVLAQGV